PLVYRNPEKSILRTEDRALRFVCLTSPSSRQGQSSFLWKWLCRAMKSGGPWNLRGLRPETREAAREAARRSGMSVGEWLNSVIAQGDEDYDEPMRSADYDDDDDWRDEPRRERRPEPR